MNELLKTDFQYEVELAGCVELYHPSKSGTFFVFEQKLDSSNGFIPLQYGMYCFLISPELDIAIRQDFNSLSQVYETLQNLIEEGWILNIGTKYLNIPKKNFIKWQLCAKIR
jgi:hypothetical protein